MANDITIPASGTGTATPVVKTTEFTSKHVQHMLLADPSTGEALTNVVVTAADDAAYTPASVVMGGAMVDDTSVNTLDEGDAGYMRQTANRALHVHLRAATDVPIGDATTPLVVGGNVAHDAADAGNPHKVGGKASTSLAGVTAAADADRVDFRATTDGRQITHPYCSPEDIVSGVAAITDGSSTSVIASSGSGVRTYITSVSIANTSATPVTVDIRDGAAGTVMATFMAPAGGGCVLALPVPLRGSAATAWCADPSASASTVTVTLVGFKSKV